MMVNRLLLHFKLISNSAKEKKKGKRKKKKKKKKDLSYEQKCMMK
jgi:hypothetical protein